MDTLTVQDRSSGNAVHSTTGEASSSLDLLGGLGWEHLDSSNGLDLGTHLLVDETGSPSLPEDFTELGDFADPAAAGLEALTPAERRAQSNRLAQRRARARRKARAEGTEAQLAVTSAELQELQNKQKALEARNSLLEKMVQLNQTTQQPERQARSPAMVGKLSSACCPYTCRNRSISHYCRGRRTSERPAASHVCPVQQQSSLPVRWQ